MAAAALEAGDRVVVVSGPVEAQYPAGVEVIPVVSTEDMLAACRKVFPECDGLIATAAPCDYRPTSVAAHKIHKTGGSLCIELVETPDVVASLAEGKKDGQWTVAFALETEDQHLRAMQKLERKRCDLIVLNGPEAIDAVETRVEILGKDGRSVGNFAGSKRDAAKMILDTIHTYLVK